MEDYPLCACGCGERVKVKGTKFVSDHRRKNVNNIRITNDILKDRVIDAGYLTKNKTIKTNCKTIKPRRGQVRVLKDTYIQTSFKSPYNEFDLYYTSSHVLAAMIYIGEIPDGQWVLHKCDIKLCCNPEHIYIGTSKQNHLDYSNRRGIYTPNSNLTRHCCESIKYYKNLGEHNFQEIAESHGCSPRTVFGIEERNFTTDGSEVIGDIFIPRIIPEPRKVTRLKHYIKTGKELSEIYDSLKERFPPWTKQGLTKKFFQICWHIYGLGRRAPVIYMKLYKANIHRKNYKYSAHMLFEMIMDGIDVSVVI